MRGEDVKSELPLRLPIGDRHFDFEMRPLRDQHGVDMLSVLGASWGSLARPELWVGAAAGIAIIVLLVRGVRGAILTGIVGATVLALIVEAVFDVGPQRDATGKLTNPTGWGLNVPAFPDRFVEVPNLGLLGQFDLLGSFSRIGIVAALLLVFTLLLADFFDTMGTMVAVGAEAGLLDEAGDPPNAQRILLVDSVAAAAGGAAGVVQ